MKKVILLTAITALGAVAILQSCKKITEGIQLNVDAGYITNHVMVVVQDAADNTVPPGATITISGDAADDVYCIDGKKNFSLNPDFGATTIGLGPGAKPMPDKPVFYTINVTADGYMPVKKNMIIEQSPNDQTITIKMVSYQKGGPNVHISKQSIDVKGGATTANFNMTAKTTSDGSPVTVTIDTGTKFINAQEYMHYVENYSGKPDTITSGWGVQRDSISESSFYNGNGKLLTTIIRGDSNISAANPLVAPYTCWQNLIRWTGDHSETILVNIHVIASPTVMVSGYDELSGTSIRQIPDGTGNVSVGNYSGNIADNIFHVNIPFSGSINNNYTNIHSEVYNFTDFCKYSFYATSKPITITLDISDTTYNTFTHARIKAGDSIDLYENTGLYTSMNVLHVASRTVIYNDNGKLKASFKTYNLGQFFVGWYEWNENPGLTIVKLLNHSKYPYGVYRFSLVNKVSGQPIPYGEYSTGDSINTVYVRNFSKDETVLQITPSATSMPCITHLFVSPVSVEIPIVSSGVSNITKDLTSLITSDLLPPLVTIHAEVISKDANDKTVNCSNINIFYQEINSSDWKQLGLFSGATHTMSSYCLQVGKEYRFKAAFYTATPIGTFNVYKQNIDTTIIWPW